MLKDTATVLRSAKPGRRGGGDATEQDSRAGTTKPSAAFCLRKVFSQRVSLILEGRKHSSQKRASRTN